MCVELTKCGKCNFDIFPGQDAACLEGRQYHKNCLSNQLDESDVQLEHAFMTLVVSDSDKNTGIVKLSMEDSMDFIKGYIGLRDILEGKYIKWEGFPRNGEITRVKSIEV